MEITGGSVTLAGPLANWDVNGGTVSGLGQVSGTINFYSGNIAGANSVNGVLNWYGGQLDSGAELTVLTNAVMNIEGNIDVYGEVTNCGTVNWEGGEVSVYYYGYCYGGNGEIWNETNALWDIQCDQTMSFGDPCGSYAVATFHNAGNLLKSADGGTTSFGLYLDNTGAVEAQNGAIDFNGGSDFGGSFQADTNAAIYFDGGTYTLGSAPNLEGPGTVELADANVVLNNCTGTLDVSDGELSGTLAGTLNISGGQLDGDVTVLPNAVMNIEGDIQIFGRLINEGTVNWQVGEVDVVNYPPYGWAGEIWNETNALWDIQCDQTLSYSDYLPTFNNAGTLRKSAGSGTTSFNNYLENRGVLDAEAGVMELDGGVDLSGGTFNFGISGLTQYGRVSIPGVAALDGTLSATLNNGYAPSPGNSFEVLSYGSETNVFESVDLPAQVPFNVNYGSEALTLSVPGSPSCMPPPSGLVDWWPGDGNANDIVAGNNGTFTNGVTYVPGEVGQAFNFNSDSSMVVIGNPVSLQLQNFTIEFWVQRGSATIATSDPTSGAGYAIMFGYGRYGYTFGMTPAGALILSQVDVNGAFSTAAVTDTNWHHVAVTTSGGTVVFYIDGVAYPYGSYNPTYQFTTPAAISGRADNLNANNNASFLGSIDEVSVYNRALSANEIYAIYAAGSAGKCMNELSPVIIEQPTNQIATEGDLVTFTVSAYGTAPLAYQWMLNGAKLADNGRITGSQSNALTISSTLAGDAGTYSVVVSNAFGTNTSQPATLALYPSTSWPASALGWYQAGYTNDGVYTVDPDGPGGTPFNVNCLMSMAGGGWTELTAEVADSFLNTDTNTSREYLYVQNGTVNYYRTPDSTLVWSWSSGQDLYGTYYYSTGSGEQSFVITPSGEHQSYGIGGSSGGGGTYKCLVIYSTCLDPADAQVQLCQDQPGIFGGACQCGVTVYFRENGPPAQSGAPEIPVPPANQLVGTGSNVRFGVTAVGSQPLFYQWLFNGTNLTDSAQIAGSLSNVLTLAGVTINNSGTYEVIVTNAYGSTNASATLTVELPTLTIAAINTNMSYGGTVPSLSVNYSGFINGDTPTSLTVAPSVSTTGTSLSHAGSYQITVGGAVDTNYNIVYVPGKLTINPAPLVITANNAAKLYGQTGTLPSTAFVASGLLNGDTIAGVMWTSTGSGADGRRGLLSCRAQCRVRAKGGQLFNHLQQWRAGGEPGDAHAYRQQCEQVFWEDTDLRWDGVHGRRSAKRRDSGIRHADQPWRGLLRDGERISLPHYAQCRNWRDVQPRQLYRRLREWIVDS